MYNKQWVCTVCGYNMIGEMNERALETVCGYNFVAEFDSWHSDFRRLVN